MYPILFLLVTLLVLPAGCVRQRTADLGGGTAFDGVSADYPGDALILAHTAAEELSRRLPPARTTLVLDKADSPFGRDLESALRSQGFSIASSDASGIQVTYTLDMLRDETPPTCYLRVRTSDGSVFGSLRVLTGESRPTTKVPAATDWDPELLPQAHDLETTPPAAPAVPPAASGAPVPREASASTSAGDKSPSAVIPPANPGNLQAKHQLEPGQRRMVGMSGKDKCDSAIEGRVLLDSSQNLYICRHGKMKILDTDMFKNAVLARDGDVILKPACASPRIAVAPTIPPGSKASPLASFHAWSINANDKEWQVHLRSLTGGNISDVRILVHTSCAKENDHAQRSKRIR